MAKRHNLLNASCQCEYRQTVKYVSTDRLIQDLTHQGRFDKIQKYASFWIPVQKSQCVIQQKIFWIQKILLEEFVRIYQIQRIGIHAYSLITHILYVDLGTIEKDPSQKDTDKHTTSRRNLRDAHSFSCQLILHFQPN